MLEQESLTRNDFFFLMTRHMVFLLNNNTQIGITFPFPSWCMHAFVLSHVWLFATPWTVARRTPLSMEFSRQEYWNGLPSPSPGDLPERVTNHPIVLATGDLYVLPSVLFLGALYILSA